MTTTMSGAELKTRLDGLGLPPSWFADRMSVTMRTVVRWFDSAAVGTEVADEVEEISALTVDEMREVLSEFHAMDVTDEVTLRTYRTDREFSAHASTTWPASWHRALTFRVWEHLRAQDVTVHIEYVS